MLSLHMLLCLQASQVAERLVDAQLAAGDLQGARHTLRQALEARIALLGRCGQQCPQVCGRCTVAPARPAKPRNLGLVWWLSA